jgi:hypothetical protein
MSSARFCVLLTLVLVLPCAGCSAGAKPEVAPAPDQRKAGAPVAGGEADTERKIIHTATLEIVVDNFDEKREELERLIAQTKGYISRSEFTGNIGSKRIGIWTIRVPVDVMPSFVSTVANLGQPVKHNTDAQDVTEDYVDTQAILTSLRESETKLNQLMKEKAQTLQDFSIWEEKTASVRKEIARLDAHMKKLTRLTAMATVNVTLRDDKAYLPTTSPEYGTTIGRTFWNSVNALRDFGWGCVIVLVAVAIWSPLILVGFLVLRWLIRRVKRELGPTSLATK